jgi:hypothetical protein
MIRIKSYISLDPLEHGKDQDQETARFFADFAFASQFDNVASLMKSSSDIFESDFRFGLETLEFIDTDGSIFNSTDVQNPVDFFELSQKAKRHLSILLWFWFGDSRVYRH